MKLTLRAMCFGEEEERVEVVTLVQGTETSSMFLLLRMRIGRREDGEDREKRGVY